MARREIRTASVPADWPFARRAANSETFVDPVDPSKQKTVFYAGNMWVKGFDTGLYHDHSASRFVAGALEVRTPNIAFRRSGSGLTLLDSDDDSPYADIAFTVQRDESGRWVDIPQAPVVSLDTGVGPEEDRTFTIPFVGTAASLTVQMNSRTARGKWSYDVKAHQAGRYRLRIAVTPTVPTTFFDSYPTTTKTTPRTVKTVYPDRPASCVWYRGGPEEPMRFSWMDAERADQIAERDVSQAGVTLTTVATSLAVGEVFTIDPSFSDDADWSADIQDDGTKFPSDTSDFIGMESGPKTYRTAIKFTISSLTAGDDVDQVDLQVLCSQAHSASYEFGCYSTDGQDDPEADAGSTAYTRSDPGNIYLTTTTFGSTISFTYTDLGAQAQADVKAAKVAGTIYSMAIKLTTESGTDHADTAEFDQADPPTLTVTHSTPAAGGQPAIKRGWGTPGMVGYSLGAN